MHQVVSYQGRLTAAAPQVSWHLMLSSWVELFCENMTQLYTAYVAACCSALIACVRRASPRTKGLQLTCAQRLVLTLGFAAFSWPSKSACISSRRW